MSAADIERTFTSTGLESKAARVAREALALRAAEDVTGAEGGSSRQNEIIRLDDGSIFRITGEYKSMVSNLDDFDELLRLEAMDYLIVLDSKIIASHAPAIVPKLKHASQPEALRALDMLEKLSVDELANHAVAVASRLDDPDDSIREKAARVLGRLRCDQLVSKLTSKAGIAYESFPHDVVFKNSPGTLVRALSGRSPADIESAMGLARGRQDVALERQLVGYLLSDDHERKALPSQQIETNVAVLAPE